MRKIEFLFLLFCILAVVFSCSAPSGTPQNDEKGNVQFGMSSGGNVPGPAGSRCDESPDALSVSPFAIVVTIEDPEGNIIYDTKSIILYNMNESFISEPLPLEPGHYRLTKFMVVDADNNVLYAAPLKGSALAYLSEKPLPIEFTIKKDKVTTLMPELLIIGTNTPADFGYASFKFDIIRTFNFQVGVFIYNGNEMEMASAKIKIASDNKVIFSDTLEAVTSNIILKDGEESYTIEISKENYGTYKKTFSAEELKAYSECPLVVVLQYKPVIFEENFNSTTLSDGWFVKYFKNYGDYSLTDEPGNLRYYIEGTMGYSTGWANDYIVYAWHPTTTLIRDFSGDKWSLNAKITFALHSRSGDGSNGAQRGEFHIAFGSGNENFLTFDRGTDYWYDANWLNVFVKNTGGTPDLMEGGPDLRAQEDVDVNEWMNYTYYYKVERDGLAVNVYISYNGINFLKARTFTLPTAVGDTQRMIIDGNVWTTAGSYMSIDYIKVSGL